MIRIDHFVALSVAGLLAATAGAAHAQMKPHYLAAAGVALPTGTFSDGNDVGYDLNAGIELRSPAAPIGVRLEGSYTEFNNSGVGGKSIIDGGSANLVYTLFGVAPGTSRTSAPAIYTIGGIGYYGAREPEFVATPFAGETETFSQTSVGWNLGGGIRFPMSGFDAYIEARYFAVSDAGALYVPITFGLIF